MFGYGFTIFRVRGVPVKLDLSMLLFLPYLAFAGAYQYVRVAQMLGIAPESNPLPPIAWGAILAVGLFVSVLLHEMAHTLVALRAGARVKSITLMMLGGVTEIEREVRPEREAWMAFVGPLSSFAIALAGYAVYRFVPLPAGFPAAVLTLAFMNALLGGFNLLPAFPMDGGRVVRGLLLPRLGPERATRVATSLGKGLAIAFGIYGAVSFNFILLFIAFFVFSGATAEETRFRARGLLRGMPIGRFMSDRIGEALADEPASEVASRLLRDNLVGARVVDLDGVGAPAHRRTLGVVTASELAERASHGEGSLPVAKTMHTDFPKLHPEDDASEAVDLLSMGRERAIAVVDAFDDVIGLVTAVELERAVALGLIGRASRRS